MRIVPATLVFGAPAIAVVAISAAVTLRRTEAAVRPEPARFSGSTVVQGLPSLLASARLADELPVAVIRDDAAASFYDSPSVLDSIVTMWRTSLAAIGADARVVTPVEARDDRSARVLVVPSSPCLTVATREALVDAAARGVGVILTGAAGTYDAGCRPLGYGLVIGSTGAERADVLDHRGMTYVTVPASGPLAADVPPGARLALNPGRQIALRDVTRDAFYSDYSLQPEPAHRQPLLDAAVTHAAIAGHRIVYWGFEISDVVQRPWDRGIARLLVRNAVAWAAGEPVASVEPWPWGKRAAASIAQDVEGGFANARAAADSLRAAGVRSTFYLTSELAMRYGRQSRRLAESNEIGTHGETYHLLGGLPADSQRVRLEATQSELSDVVGKDVRGLRPPEEQFDTATMSAWLAAKGDYLFGANDSRSAAPELIRIEDDTLVLVGHVGSDDFAAVARRTRGSDRIAANVLGDFERIRALGGHYVLSSRSHVMARPELVRALATVARRLAADTDVWVAPVGDVAEWWRARARMTVRARIAGARMQVSVRNPTDQTISGAVVRVVLPDARRAIHADAPVLPAPTQVIRLAVPSLPAHSTRTITVVLQSTSDNSS